MKQLQTKTHLNHQELSQLLPWYVNKTLRGAELKAVEEHVSVCLTCKREAMQLNRLAQAVIHEGALDSAEKASFSRLKMRLHGSDQTTSLNQANHVDQDKLVSFDKAKLMSSQKTKARSFDTWSRSGLAMAASVLLAVIVFMPGLVEQQSNDFRTLSDSKQIENVNANEIRVVFAEGINQQQKNTILERVHGQIIDTPTAQGVYTVRLERDIATKHLLDVIDLLRKDSKVIFAEPTYALLSSMHAEK